MKILLIIIGALIILAIIIVAAFLGGMYYLGKVMGLNDFVDELEGSGGKKE